MKKNDLTGKRFGRLTVISEDPSRDKHGKILWLCKCDCGRELSVLGRSLVNGHTKSCGCYKDDVLHNRAKHRLIKTPTYRCWSAMKDRCLNQNSSRYYDYGGRGITVCDRWLDFINFLEDMGERPSEYHSIDRIDNNKGYYPGNCKWATEKEQQNNKRSNLQIAYKGISKTLMEWCNELNLNYHKMRDRIYFLGWSVERAFEKKS